MLHVLFHNQLSEEKITNFNINLSSSISLNRCTFCKYLNKYLGLSKIKDCGNVAHFTYVYLLQ